MTRFLSAALFAAAFGSTLSLAACNGDTPAAQVGSGAGPTNGTAAPSGRVSTQDEAKQTGGGS